MENDFHTVEKSTSVRSVTRALDLLTALGKGGRTLTELSRTVGISPSTASRLLGTLQGQGFVSVTSENRYVPGLALTSLLYSTDQWAPLRRVAKEATEALRAELGETSVLFVRAATERLCIESAESTQMVRRVCLPGERGKIYLGAAGKTLLAFGPEQDALIGLDASQSSFKTATNITRSVADLSEELEQIRLQGYAFSRQESTMESWAVAAPLQFDQTIFGALTMVIPTTRYSADYLERVIKATMKIANMYSDKPKAERRSSNDRKKPVVRKRPKRNPQSA
jgi:DNA-binding IclR family transcriptional regulator